MLLGAPGSGKGTQANIICKKYNIPHISTGNMLRDAIQHKDSLGIKIKNIMDTGALISDDLIVKLVQQRISSADCASGYLLDGFPRTINQAEAMKELDIKIDYILELDVPDQILIERISGRRIHHKSGRIYHIKFDPPAIENVDDVTGEPLLQRDDDTEETICKRLNVYHDQTTPLIEYYANYKNSANLPGYLKIDGTKELQTISEDIFSFVDKHLTA